MHITSPVYMNAVHTNTLHCNAIFSEKHALVLLPLCSLWIKQLSKLQSTLQVAASAKDIA
jgi:hypothetical protein